MIFLPNFLQIGPMFFFFFFFFFLGGQNGTHVYRFFLYKIHLLGRNNPVYLTYVKFIPPPPPGPGCRGTQIIPISLMNGTHCYENFATKLSKKKKKKKKKKVGKGHLCERVILAGTLE